MKIFSKFFYDAKTGLGIWIFVAVWVSVAAYWAWWKECLYWELRLQRLPNCLHHRPLNMTVLDTHHRAALFGGLFNRNPIKLLSYDLKATRDHIWKITPNHMSMGHESNKTYKRNGDPLSDFPNGLEDLKN